MSNVQTLVEDSPPATSNELAARQCEFLVAAERKVSSQFNEDGILALLFDRLGAGNKRFVEFGIGNGKECNTANLSLNHGWSGLLMDGDARLAGRARQFYASGPAAGRVTANHAFITAENINILLSAHADQGSTDLLSIDIDGNDLWVWRAISAVQPRVVVIEYNATFGSDRSVSVRYDPEFDRLRFHPSGLGHGASLAALVAVGREKGLALIGCESHGVNAFFVHRSLLRQAGLVEVTASQAYYPHASRVARLGSSEDQFALIEHLDFARI